MNGHGNPREIHPLRVVVLHADADKTHCEELLKHLRLLHTDDSPVMLWSRLSIQGGQKRDEELRREFEAADLRIILLSIDLLNDENIQPFATRAVRERPERIPVLLRSFDVEGTPFADIQLLPTNGKTIASEDNQDQAWTEITEATRTRLDTLRRQRDEGKLPNLRREEEWLEEYQRALREVAGQVGIPGDPHARRLEDVYVELQMHRHGNLEQKQDQVPSEHKPSGNRGDDALWEETTRRNEAWKGYLDSSIISTDCLPKLAPRILLWGKAGTGKSTLLKQMASHPPTGIFYVWITGLPKVLEGETFSQSIVRQALVDAILPANDALQRDLLQKLESGSAHLLMDGLDEMTTQERSNLKAWLRELHPDTRVLIASRPSEIKIPGLEEWELEGLGIAGPERLVMRYFGDPPWCGELMRALESLPDGETWRSTPVLLLLSAGLYKENKTLPSNMLDIHDKALQIWLKRACERWKAFQPEALKARLIKLAGTMLAPAEGEDVRVEFERDELSEEEEEREALLSTGLFAGRKRLRFAHLSLGEYLAAQSELNMKRGWESFLEGSEKHPGHTLNVLPMALASKGLDALKELWEGVKQRDKADHRLFRLLLRALAMGGEGAKRFGERSGERLVVELGQRLNQASGRFDDMERRLMGDVERALPVIRAYIRPHVADELAACSYMSRGELGTEVYALLLNLDPDRTLERRESRFWDTIIRQARALVRSGREMEELVEHTMGDTDGDAHIPIEKLAAYEKYWPDLRPLLDDRTFWVRHYAVEALQGDPMSLALIRECLGLDDQLIQGDAAHAMGQCGALEDNAAALWGALDVNPRVSFEATLNVLKNHRPSWPRLRTLIQRFLDAKRFPGDPANMVSVLLPDPEAEELIRTFVRTAPTWWLNRSFADKLLEQYPWEELLIQRMIDGKPTRGLLNALASRGSASTQAILKQYLDSPDIRLRLDAAWAMRHHEKAMALIRNAVIYQLDKLLTLDGDKNLFAYLRRFKDDAQVFDALQAHIRPLQGNPEEHNCRIRAIHAIATIDLDRARPILWKFFEATPSREHDQNSSARPCVLVALQEDPQSTSLLLKALQDKDQEVRKTAIRCLRQREEAKDAIRALWNDKNRDIALSALGALSGEPEAQQRLLQALRRDDELLRRAILLLLIPRERERGRILELFRDPPNGAVQISAVVPLCMLPQTREEVYTCMDRLESFQAELVAHLLPGDPEVRKRALLSFQNQASVLHIVARGRVKWLTDLLGTGPEAIELYKKCLLMHVYGFTSVYAFAEALAKTPDGRSFLLGALRNPEAQDPGLLVYAIRALADDDEIKRSIPDGLRQNDAHDGILNAYIYAAGKYKEFLPLVPPFLDNSRKSTRLEAVQALAHDSESRPLLRARLEQEKEPNVSNALLDALSGDPESFPVFRKMLHDCDQGVRQKARRLLQHTPVSKASSFRAIKSIRRAIRLLHDPTAPDVSPEPVPGDPIEEWLLPLTQSPRLTHIDTNPEYHEAILGWLIARMTCSLPDEQGHTRFEVWGETQEDLRSLRPHPNQLILVRIAMDPADLPRERRIHPMHNLIEAWRVAKYLYMAHSPTLMLVCADVDFDHLEPPSLKPGQVRWGPTCYGFRLAETEEEARGA